MDGIFSERLAYTLSNEIIGKSEYYIDLHGGEFNEKLLNYLYFFMVARIKNYADSQE